MDKLKYIKLEQPDGSYSNSIPLAVDSDYVDVNGNTLTNELNNKATKVEVAAVASGSPAGVYTTVAALTTADPDHSKIYVVTADGHWYYYANSQWNDGGAYQAAEIADDSITLNKVVNSIRQATIELNSLIMDFTTELTDVISGTGTIGHYTNWFSSDYIELPIDVTTIRFEDVPTSYTNINAISFFDANKDYIIGINKSTSNLNKEEIKDNNNNPLYTSVDGFYNIPTNAKYMKVTHYDNGTIKSKNKVYDFNANNINYHIFADNSKEENEKLINEMKVYVDFATIPNFINETISETGDINHYNNWYSTDYIEIPKNTSSINFIKVPTHYHDINAISFFDENQDYISGFNRYINGVSGETVESGIQYISYYGITGTLNIPQNAKYIRYTKYIVNDFESVSIVRHLLNNKDILKLNDPAILNDWKDKKCCFIGDSITAGAGTSYGNRYYDFLKTFRGINPIHYGVGGYRMIDCYELAQQMYDTEGQNLDAIFVFAGTNDFYMNTPLGDWYNETQETIIINSDTQATTTRTKRNFVLNNNTFKGAINILMGYLKNKYPTKQIVLMTPIHRSYAKFSATNIQYDELYQNHIGNYFDEYINTILEAGKIYSVPVIDLYNDCGLFPLDNNYSQYFADEDTDMLHPNALGHQRIARCISSKLNSITSSFVIN